MNTSTNDHRHELWNSVKISTADCDGFATAIQVESWMFGAFNSLSFLSPELVYLDKSLSCRHSLNKNVVNEVVVWCNDEVDGLGMVVSNLK
ncbi:unnamed protein product [Lathyrus sativus]|nr:unnamed protein product [Lathyrus sativus]